MDPDVGAVFYILDPVRGGRLPRATRTQDCMNCHTPTYLDGIPALVIESVVPAITGGGEKAFRRARAGHNVPIEERFGGWLVTGAPDAMRHWGNLVMEYNQSGRHERKVAFGELFDVTRYPAPMSDILPHLLHEHQVGFENRAMLAGYRFREWCQARTAQSDDFSAEVDACMLEEISAPLLDYLLFADEARFPPGGIVGNTRFKAEFAANKRPAANGASLKDLELGERLLKYRCSYMIYGPAFTGLPGALKQSIYHKLQNALADEPVPRRFAYLSLDERRSIRTILTETVTDFAVRAVRDVHGAGEPAE
jgi:hypothetical protein